MPIIHAIVLGIVQGFTEFLPISSSGHLAVVPWLFGWEELTSNPSLNQTFDVALHVGTLFGVIAYFWRDLWSIVVNGLVGRRVAGPEAAALAVEAAEEAAVVEGGGRGAEDTRELELRTGAGAAALASAVRPDDRRMLFVLICASVPAALTGAVLDDVLAEAVERIWLIAVALIVFGLILGWADRRRGDRAVADVSVRDGLLMGLAQVAALQPGVSRSGVTMSAGRALGFDRDAAARLSFLMLVPITAGAVLYKGAEVFTGDGIPAGFEGAFAAGILTSAVTGWIAVWGTLRLIRTRTFTPFVLYRVAAGAGILAIYFLR